MTPIKAIRLKCLDCCCGSAHEVKLCPCTDCSLYRFRMGHNPNIKRKGSGEGFPENTLAEGPFEEEVCG